MDFIVNAGHVIVVVAAVLLLAYGGRRPREAGAPARRDRRDRDRTARRPGDPGRRRSPGDRRAVASPRDEWDCGWSVASAWRCSSRAWPSKC